jgi:hypothetical protein
MVQIITPYLQALSSEQSRYQQLINDLIKKYQIQPVGTGYVDLIATRINALKFLDDLTKNLIAVETVALWCHVTEENKKTLGCPHGLGGPLNKFGEGWFSEFCYFYFDVKDYGIDLDDKSIQPEMFVKQSNQLVKKYLEKGLLEKDYYTACIHPALWLNVPKEWNRPE